MDLISAAVLTPANTLEGCTQVQLEYDTPDGTDFLVLFILSTIVGFSLSSLALGSAGGSLILSFMLDMTESYTPFMIFAAVASVLGSGLFLMLGRHPTVIHERAVH